MGYFTPSERACGTHWIEGWGKSYIKRYELKIGCRTPSSNCYYAYNNFHTHLKSHSVKSVLQNVIIRILSLPYIDKTIVLKVINSNIYLNILSEE